MVWGVSRSDVTNCGWNTAVGFGVLTACAGTAFIVRLIAHKFLAESNGDVKKDNQSYAQYGSLALGVAVTGAAYMYIPGSRFALITDDSTSKMLKLGTVQALAGAAIDYFDSNQSNIAAIVGLGGALATRYGNLVLAGFGLLGTGLGSGYIQR